VVCCGVLGKVLGCLYQLGKWVRLFWPFCLQGFRVGGAPDDPFRSSYAYLLPRWWFWNFRNLFIYFVGGEKWM